MKKLILFCLLLLCGPASAQTLSIGPTVERCVTPTITTASAYGTDYVVGGLLTFTNVFPTGRGGVVESVYATMAHVETQGFTFFLFSSNPAATTWTDDMAAAINSADVGRVRATVSLNASSALGTHTIAYNAGLGFAQGAVGGTTVYGILLTNAALTNNFSSATELQVAVTRPGTIRNLRVQVAGAVGDGVCAGEGGDVVALLVGPGIGGDGVAPGGDGPLGGAAVGAGPENPARVVVRG